MDLSRLATATFEYRGDIEICQRWRVPARQMLISYRQTSNLPQFRRRHVMPDGTHIDILWNNALARVVITAPTSEQIIVTSEQISFIFLESGYMTGVQRIRSGPNEQTLLDAARLVGGEKQIGVEEWLDELSFKLPDKFFWKNRAYSADGIDSIAIPATNAPPNLEQADREAYLQKRDAAALVPLGALTGKTQLFAQAALGSKKRFDIRHDETLNGNKIVIGGERLDCGQSDTHGILQTESGEYYLINLRWQAGQAQARRITLSPTAQQLSQYVIDNDDELSHSDRLKLEGYILADATFANDDEWFAIADDEVINAGINPLDHVPLAYGWQFSYSGYRADIVAHKQNGYFYNTHPVIYSYTSHHISVTISENSQFDQSLPIGADNLPFTASAAEISSDEFLWGNEENIFVPQILLGQIRALDRITLFPADPAIGTYTGASDAPIYCWFEADNEEPEIVRYQSSGVDDSATVGAGISFSSDLFLCNPGFKRLIAANPATIRSSGFVIDGPTYSETTVGDNIIAGFLQLSEITVVDDGTETVVRSSFYADTAGADCPTTPNPYPTADRYDNFTAKGYKDVRDYTGESLFKNHGFVMIPLESSKGVYIGQSVVDDTSAGTSTEIHREPASVGSEVQGLQAAGTDPDTGNTIYVPIGPRVPRYFYSDRNNGGGTVTSTTFHEAETVVQWVKICAPGREAEIIHEREAAGDRVVIGSGDPPENVNFERGQWDTQLFERKPSVDPNVEIFINLEAGMHGTLAHWSGTNEQFIQWVSSGEFPDDVVLTGTPIGWQ